MTTKTTATAKKWQALHEKAHQAGITAALAKVPTPMIVGTPTRPFGNDIDYTEQTYIVPGGVCGFAWVWTSGRGFGGWLLKNGHAKYHYGGGVSVWVGRDQHPVLNTQSMEIKEAYADAYAEVCRQAGVTAYGQSRMD